MQKEIKHIYLHIPFANSNRFAKSEVDMYFFALKNEFDKFFKKKEIASNLRTLYVASDISDTYLLEKLLDFLNYTKTYLVFSPEIEFSLELRPNKFAEHVLQSLFDIGINRIVLKFYSFNEKYAKLSGNQHNSEIPELISKIRNYGINNISGDFIYNYPAQSDDELKFDLQNVILYGFKHIYISEFLNPSLGSNIEIYSDEDISSLEYSAELNKDLNPMISNDREREFYHYVRKFFCENNLKHYELYGFAQNQEFFSKHNLAYWRGEEYLGFGSAAASYFNAKRFSNFSNLNKYIESKLSANKYEFIEFIDREEAKREFFLLRFNNLDGFSEKEYWEIFGEQISQTILDKLEYFVDKGWLKRNSYNYALSSLGLDFVDYILREILYS